MYQQYINEARAAQYQQQCRHEGAIERHLRVGPPSDPAKPAPGKLPGGRVLGAATWMRRLIPRPAAAK